MSDATSSATDESSDADFETRIDVTVWGGDPANDPNFKRLSDEPQDVKDACIHRIIKLCTDEFVVMVTDLRKLDLIVDDDEARTLADRRADAATEASGRARHLLQDRGIVFGEVDTGSTPPNHHTPIEISMLLIFRKLDDHVDTFRKLTGSELSQQAVSRLVKTFLTSIFAVDAVVASIYVTNEDAAADDEEDESESSEESSEEDDDSTDEEEDSATSESDEEDEPEAKRPRHEPKE